MSKTSKKTARNGKAAAQPTRMTTGEAVVSSLLAHGIDTVYALPGVHNDHFFDALYKAQNRVRVVHTRHEQGSAYMALGAALATGKPQAYCVVPGPGLLNTGAALLTAYSMNAPVLALIGQIPQNGIRRDLGHLHEIRDQAGIIERLVDHSALIPRAADAPRLVAAAVQSLFTGRPGPAALECAMDVWGRSEPVRPMAPLDVFEPPIDDEAITAAAKLLGAAKNPIIICGGGAQDASSEVTRLSAMLQAPVAGFRRGRGVLDSRDPLSVTLPLANDLWREVDVAISVGSRMFFQLNNWGVDKDIKLIRVDADPDEADRSVKANVSLVGDSALVLRKLLAALPAHNMKRKSRKPEMEERQAKLRKRLEKLGPQLAILEAIRAELPEDGIFVDEVTQIGFAARLAMPFYKPRTFISPGYQDNLGWGFATALGVQDARRDVPVLSISGDGGFLYTASELASAVRHKIPLVTVVFNNNAFGNVKLIQQDWYGGRTIASDLTNPDFVKLAEAFGVEAERVETPAQLRSALRRGFKRRGGPTLIEMPVGPMPSPWDFIFLPRVRGISPGMDLITTTSDLADACARLSQHPFVTVDTEFLRESTYYPQLCVAQIASPDEAVVVDTLAPGIDLTPFFELMGNERVLKVFHAARQDIEIVWHRANLIPHPVFDTQIAAMVLGHGESVSYDQLVQRITGDNLDKSSRFTDWTRRPLSQAQIEYAISDVTHLRDVYRKLQSDLDKRDRSGWLSEEMEVLTSPDTYRMEPDDAWMRLRTRVRKPKELAVLMEVAAWREREAKARDVPRGRVLKDDLVADIAIQAPTTIERLASLRSMPKGFERSAWGREIPEIVKRGLARDPKSLPTIERNKHAQNSSATIELLKVLLRMTAERHAVAAKVIATVDDLEQIAGDDNADVPALKGWRRELFGEKALALKSGRLALAIEKGRVSAIERERDVS